MYSSANRLFIVSFAHAVTSVARSRNCANLASSELSTGVRLKIVRSPSTVLRDHGNGGVSDTRSAFSSIVGSRSMIASARIAVAERADDERLGVVLGQPAQDDLVLELHRALEHALLEVVADHRRERRERAGEPVDAAGLGDAARVVGDHAGGVLGVGDVELVLLDHALVDQVHAAVLDVLVGLDVGHRELATWGPARRRGGAGSARCRSARERA